MGGAAFAESVGVLEEAVDAEADWQTQVSVGVGGAFSALTVVLKVSRRTDIAVAVLPCRNEAAPCWTDQNEEQAEGVGLADGSAAARQREWGGAVHDVLGCLHRPEAEDGEQSALY